MLRMIASLNHVAATGAIVDYKGKQWTFTPVTFIDLAEIVSAKRSRELRAYFAATEGTKTDRLQRISDINGILGRPTSMEELNLLDPDVMLTMAHRSLKKKHSECTVEQVQAMLMDEEFVEKLAAVMPVINNGPLDMREGGGTGATHPTQTLSDSTK